MSLFTIDEQKCNRDGICAAECPAGIIQMGDEKSVPTPVELAEKICIRCGHCVTVCPNQAFLLNGMLPKDCEPIKTEMFPNTEELEHFMRSRRSIRTYKDKAVGRDVIEKALDIARYAPSGINLQPVRWLVIYEKSDVQKLAGHVINWMEHLVKTEKDPAIVFPMRRLIKAWDSGIDRICRNATHVIIAHAQKKDRTAPAACIIALTYLELILPTMGIGNCWAGYLTTAATLWPPLQEALALPEGDITYGGLMFGFPKFKYHRIPSRNPARVSWYKS